MILVIKENYSSRFKSGQQNTVKIIYEGGTISDTLKHVSLLRGLINQYSSRTGLLRLQLRVRSVNNFSNQSSRFGRCVARSQSFINNHVFTLPDNCHHIHRGTTFSHRHYGRRKRTRNFRTSSSSTNKALNLTLRKDDRDILV